MRLLTKAHKWKRLELLRKWLSSKIKWRRVLVSDEKKWNIMGFDGCICRWVHKDTTSPLQAFEKSHKGNLADCMTRRCERVIAARGERIQRNTD